MSNNLQVLTFFLNLFDLLLFRCDEVGIKLPFEISTPCLDVLSGLLVKNPISRMVMDQLVTQPWINQVKILFFGRPFTTNENKFEAPKIYSYYAIIFRRL